MNLIEQGMIPAIITRIDVQPKANDANMKQNSDNVENKVVHTNPIQSNGVYSSIPTSSIYNNLSANNVLNSKNNTLTTSAAKVPEMAHAGVIANATTVTNAVNNSVSVIPKQTNVDVKILNNQNQYDKSEVSKQVFEKVNTADKADKTDKTDNADNKSAQEAAVEIKTPEKIKSVININELIKRLKSSDYEEQANVMEAISEKLFNDAPSSLNELFDKNIFRSLISIMNKNTSNLSKKEMQIANRNKEYAMYTYALIQDKYVKAFKSETMKSVPAKDLYKIDVILQKFKDNDMNIRNAAYKTISIIRKDNPEYDDFFKEYIDKNILSKS